MQKAGKAFASLSGPLKFLIPLERGVIVYPVYFHPHPTSDLKMESEAPGPCCPLPPSADAWGSIQGAASSPAFFSAELTQTQQKQKKILKVLFLFFFLMWSHCLLRRCQATKGKG